MSTVTTFYVGGEDVAGPLGPEVAGAMYVERHAADGGSGADRLTPIVLIHGGGGSGADWLATPDGRPGWAELLVEAGHPVYVVDRPAHGRSPYHPSMGPTTPPAGRGLLEFLFRPPALGPTASPTAYRHARWIGTGADDDPVLRRLGAASFGTLVDAAGAQARDGAAIAELLRMVGPAVLIAHSNGGPAAWVAADRAAEQVAAFVAVEVVGPPFLHDPDTGRSFPHGLCAAPLTWDPPVDDPAELRPAMLPTEAIGVPPVAVPGAGHRLRELSRFPIAVVSAEASRFRDFDDHLIRFLTAAGCRPDLLRLDEAGVTGHGHGVIWEEANDEALAVITRWLAIHQSGAEVDAEASAGGAS